MLNQDKGIYTVFTSILLVGLFLLIGMSVDSGKLELDRTKLQRASDAGAIVGASRIGNIDKTQVERLAKLVARDNIEIQNLNYDDSRVHTQVNNNVEVQVSSDITSDTFIIGKKVKGSSSWNLGSFAAASKRPVAVVLVVDVSGSMSSSSEADPHCTSNCTASRLSILKAAAKTFVNSFDENIDAFSVVAFSDTASVRYELDSPFSKNDISKVIDSFTASGRTNTHSGLVVAREQLSILPIVVGTGYTAYKKVIVLITDGAPNKSNPTLNYPTGCPSTSTRSHIILPILEADEARKEDTLLFGIGLGRSDPIKTNAFQTQPTDTGSGVYYLKEFMFRRLVNDRAEGFYNPPFPLDCFPSYGELTKYPEGSYLESPNDYDISYMLNQVSLSIKLKLTK